MSELATITLPLQPIPAHHSPLPEWCSRNASRTFQYSDCLRNYSLEQLDAIACELHSVFVTYHGWIPLPLALTSLLFVVVYMLAVWRAIAQYRVSRKCYVLLLNRAFGDMTACLTTLVICVYVLVTGGSRDALQVMDVFVVGSFWAAMVSYVALSFLKLYAIARPLHYRNRVTMRRCIYLIGLR